MASLEPVDNAGDSRGVKPDRGGEAALVQCGLARHGEQCRELYGRERLSFGFFKENGHGNLLLPPDEIAGQSVEVDGIGGAAWSVTFARRHAFQPQWRPRIPSSTKRLPK